MKSTTRIRTLVLACVVGLGVEAKATLIDFDGLTTGSQAGNVLASEGVTLTSGALSTETVNVGDTVTLTFATNFFNVLSPAGQGAVSAPNYAIGTTAARSDVLFSFSAPVISVGLATDIELNETPQLVRLLALQATGNLNEFTVLALDEGFTDAIAAPDNLLSVNLGGAFFDFALFQVIGGGAEGFDDLNFSAVPLPATIWLLSSGLGACCIAGRKKRRKG